MCAVNKHLREMSRDGLQHVLQSWFERWNKCKLLCFLCLVFLMLSSLFCKLLLYADDSAILYSNKDPQVISDKLGLELEMCSKWLVDNTLSLHMGKTECIIFGSKRKLRKINNFSVECNGHTIKAQRSVKYFGLTLDDQLTREAIVNSFVQKVNGRLKFLYRQCNFLEENLGNPYALHLSNVT